MNHLLSPERWERVKDLYASLVELPVSQRTPWLDERCPDDEVVRREVERLLAHQSGHQVSELAADIVALRPRLGQFAQGDLVAGRFRIERFLGEGGMGEVWQATDTELKRQVALKTLHPALAANPHVVDRFKREVMLASRVTHANICRIYDYGRHAEVSFLTMELVQGETLASRLEKQGRLTTDEALPLVTQICAGLAAAHAEGIVHRDFKSGNVMLSGDRAVVTDFGLARAVTAVTGEEGSEHTATGAVLGTPAYMAPEQVVGDPVTAAADIYALGVVMYEMVTGHRPFEGGSAMALMARKVRDRPTPPGSLMTGLNVAWEAVIMRCLEPAPGDRFASAEEIPAALGAGNSVVWRERWRRSGKGVSRGRGRLVAATLLLAAGAALGGWYWSTRTIGFQPKPAAARWYGLGLAALDTGSTFTASRMFEEAVKEDAQFPLAQAKLAEVYESLDMLDRSKDAQIKLTALVPDYARLPVADRLELTAVRSAVLRDYRGAAAHYEELARVTQGAASRRARLQAGRAWRAANQPEKALGQFEALRKEDGRDAAVLLQLAGLLAQKGDQKKALPLFSEAEQLYKLSANLVGVAEVRLQRAEFLMPHRPLGESRAEVESALAEINRIDSPQQRVRAEMALATIVRRGGQPDRAAAMLNATVEYARAQGAEGIAATVLNDLAFGFLAQSQLDEAKMTFEQALQTSRRTNSRGNEARANGGLAQTYTRLDRPADARPHFANAAEYFERASDQDARLALTVTMIDLEIARGDYPAVLAKSESLLRQAQQLHNTEAEAIALGRIAMGLMYLGDLPQYRQVQQQRIGQYRKLQQLSSLATNLISLAILDVKLGNLRIAHESLAEANDILIRLGGKHPRVRHRYWLAKGELAIEEERWRDALDASHLALQEDSDVVASGGGSVEPRIAACLAVIYGRLPIDDRSCNVLTATQGVTGELAATAALRRAGFLETAFAKRQYRQVLTLGPSVFEACAKDQPRLTAWRVGRMIYASARRQGQPKDAEYWEQRTSILFDEMTKNWPKADRFRALRTTASKRLD